MPDEGSAAMADKAGGTRRYFTPPNQLAMSDGEADDPMTGSLHL